jgi:hypothetical protein
MWQENNLPLHSTFRPNREFSMPAPESAFIQSFNDGWEAQKCFGWLPICGGKVEMEEIS